MSNIMINIEIISSINVDIIFAHDPTPIPLLSHYLVATGTTSSLLFICKDITTQVVSTIIHACSEDKEIDMIALILKEKFDHLARILYSVLVPLESLLKLL